MLKKHAIFCLEFFSLILLSTASLASYSSYNYSFNKNRTSYLFNKRDNFSQQFMYHDLVIKNMSYGKESEDILLTPASESENNKDTAKNWLASIWPVIWGQPFSNRFYGGMWTRHYEQRERHVKNNKLIAFCYKGIYLGTFINSYGDRTYSLGTQN